MATRSAFQIPNKAVPVEGGVGIPVTLALAGASSVSGDFGLEQTSGAIGFVQSVYIDNSQNSAALSLTFPGTQQNITVKANTQGYYPVVPFTGTFSWQATSAGGVNVPIIFMNIKFEAAQWGLSSSFNILSKSGLAVPLTGTINETILETIPVPPNSLGMNGILKVTSIWTMTNDANNKIIRVRLGTGGIASAAVGVTAGLTTIDHAYIETVISNLDATNSQGSQTLYPRGTDNLMNDGANTISNVDMTQMQNIYITGQLASVGDTLTLQSYFIETVN